MGHASFDKEKKHPGSLKGIIMDGFQITTNKDYKASDSKKRPLNNLAFPNCQSFRKQPRKGEHPVFLSPAEISHESRPAETWVCKNSACKAVLTSADSFCKRCSCCICHLFDDNKDPSLWLVCSSEFGDEDFCELSCHIECALLCQKVGVFNLGQSLVVDGSYCCASCGRVSGILACWKRQLMIAKDARRVDILCYRIYLSYRLLDGTSRFKELHQIVEEAKALLETEIGPLNGVSAKMARGIVSRLSVAGDVQKLCFSGIDKADEWLKLPLMEQIRRDFLPAACPFQFEKITSSSIVIIIKETSSLVMDTVKGYKFWHCNARQQRYEKEPVVFSSTHRRILVSNLQPCTEYSFRIISFTEDGDFGHSEAKCFTNSIKIIKHSENANTYRSRSRAKRQHHNPKSKSADFKIRNLGRILRLAWTQEGCYNEFYQDDAQQQSEDARGTDMEELPEEDHTAPTALRQLDLNEVSVPDLNVEVTPHECSPEEENGCTSEKNGLVRSNGSPDSEDCTAMLCGESRPNSRKQPPTLLEEICNGYSTLMSDSAHQFCQKLGKLDDNYEYSVKVIRWLERLGLIENDFRMKFLTWFSLRSTEQERLVVFTFIKMFIEEPSSLAEQLLDSFSEIVACKGLRDGFCSKLWH